MKLPELEKQRLLRLIGEIKSDLTDIQRIVDEAEKETKRFSVGYPTPFDIRACGSILQDFYNGVEGIFTKIAGEVNGGLPASEDWHKRLLKDMAIEIPEVRQPVISQKLCEELDDYLRFRHLFRHSYGITLHWERVKPLLESLRRILTDFNQHCERFIDFLKELVKE